MRCQTFVDQQQPKRGITFGHANNNNIIITITYHDIEPALVIPGNQIWLCACEQRKGTQFAIWWN